MPSVQIGPFEGQRPPESTPCFFKQPKLPDKNLPRGKLNKPST
jgi:hypothetical protein